jgi:hypothetical protein
VLSLLQFLDIHNAFAVMWFLKEKDKIFILLRVIMGHGTMIEAEVEIGE